MSSKTVKLRDLPIEWKRGAGLKRSDITDDGSRYCILYGELFTRHKNVLIDESRLSKTNITGKVTSRKGDILTPGTSTASRHEMILAREVDVDGILLGGDINVIRPKEGIFAKKYLSYFFETPSAYRQLERYITGSTGIIHISNAGIKNLEVPLPTLKEQEKVVAKIDELFSELERSANELTEAVQRVSKYQESTLYHAFNNLLTPNISIDDWQTSTFSELARVASNLVSPKLYPELPHIAPDNIEKNSGVLLPFRTIGEDGVTSPKHKFYEGQILYSKIRPYLNKVVIAPFEGLCSADMYPIESEILNHKFLFYYMLSRHFTDQSTTSGSRSVLPKINQHELGKIKIKYLPDKRKQKEVIEAIESQMTAISSEMQTIQEVQKGIEKMRRAIFAEAFSGDLA